MHGVLANLTAAVVLLHALLGCCCHHAHGGTAVQALGLALPSACPQPHSPSCGLAYESEHSDDEHGGSGDCHSAPCVSIRPVKALLPDLDDFGWRTAPCPSLLAGQQSLSHAGTALIDRQFFSPCGGSLPVRLHLIQQVLLI